MQLTVSSSLLSQQLVAVSGVISRNPVVPILENFLFHVVHDQLHITSSDFQTSLHTSLPIHSNIEARIAIPARILLDTVKNLPDQMIKMIIHPQSYSVTIEAETGHYQLGGENASDFPKLELAETNHVSLSLETQVFKNILHTTLFATSNDELKPAMSGLYMEIDHDQITFVSTDGHRLVRYKQPIAPLSLQTAIIIPKKPLMLLNSLASTKEEQIHIAFDQARIQFTMSGMSIITRLIDERYPDYENVIPKEHVSKLTVHRPALVSALKRASIYANKATHQVKIGITKEELILSAEDFDFSNQATEKLLCTYTGESLDIAFNGKLLLEMLLNIPTEEVTFLFWEASRAVLILPEQAKDDEKLLLLIMPITF